MLALRLTRTTVASFEGGGWNLLLHQHQRLASSREQTKKSICRPPAISTDTTKLSPTAAAPKPTTPTNATTTTTSQPPTTTPNAIDHTQECRADATKSTGPQKASSGTAKQKLSTEMVRQNVKGYVLPRYFDYVKNYDKVLEKNFPSAVKVYRVFFDGVKDFYADMKRYLKIARIINESPKGLRALNRKELELYMQMPRDMVKVAPALIGSSLPMVGYAVFPIIFMYPRTFLTSHFWSLQQRAEFQQIALKERLTCNRAVFRCLQSKLSATKNHELHKELEEVLGLLGSGFHPSMELLLKVKDIFTQPPYSLLSLSGKHIKLLCHMHGVPGGWFKRHRLTEHAFLVHHMDLAIGREGGVHNMMPEAIRQSCYIRGLNPSNLSNDEMIAWLRNWITLSTSVQEEHISFFLHLPLLLAYNHPNNWQLIYGAANQQCGNDNNNNSNSKKTK